MKIVNIARKDDNTVIVHLDNDEKLFLSYEIFMKNGLRKNEDISESRFSELIRENQLYHIKQRAARYLARRLHSTNELRIKLRQKGYDISLIDAVLNDLSEKKYLNDYEFASIFADENIRNKLWGKNKLKAELIKRGIKPNDIDRVLSEKFTSGSGDIENAAELAKKKLKLLSGRKLEQRKMKEKVMSFLMSKGYDYETVSEVVRKVMTDEEEE